MRKLAALTLMGFIAISCGDKKQNKQLVETQNQDMPFSVVNAEDRQEIRYKNAMFPLLKVRPGKYNFTRDEDSLYVRSQEDNSLQLTIKKVKAKNSGYALKLIDSSDIEGQRANADMLGISYAYTKVALDSEMIREHLGHLAKITSKEQGNQISVESNMKFSATIDSVPSVSIPNITNPQMASLFSLDNIKASYKGNIWMKDEKLKMLRPENQVTYSSIPSIDLTDALSDDFQDEISVRDAGSNFKEITIKLSSPDLKGAFLTSTPIVKFNKSKECLKLNTNGLKFDHSRQGDQMHLTTFMRNDLYESCLKDNMVQFSVQIIDENFNRINYQTN